MRKNILFTSLFLTASASFAAPDASKLINDLQNSATIVQNGGGPVAELNCENGFDNIYAQPIDPANFGTVRTSDEETDFRVFEGIVDAGALTTLPDGLMVENARIWVLSLELDPKAGFVAGCTEDDATPYTVTFFEDNAGVPGNVLATSSASVVSHVDTGIAFAFTTIQEVTLTLDTPLMTDGTVHVGFARQVGQNAASGNQCLALILDETLAASYDDTSVQFDGTMNVTQPSDHTFCLGFEEMVDPDIIFEDGFDTAPAPVL